MEGRPKTYLQAVQYLKMPRVAMNIAASQNLKGDDADFRKLYQATLNEFIKKMKSGGIAPGEPLSPKASNNIIQGFIYVLMAKYGTHQHFKTKKQMYATDDAGYAQPLIGSLNEDFDDWTEDDRKHLIQQLKDGNYIARVKHQYAKQHPHADDADFGKALHFAMDIALQQAEKYHKPPLMPSDLEEVVDGIQELVLSFEPAKSIFFSDPSAQERRPKISKDAGNHPFEKGSFADIGLNEGVGDWSQRKLDQHIKKEVEKLLKKGEYVSKKEVKDMIRKTIVKQYKYLWEKSAFFINQI